MGETGCRGGVACDDDHLYAAIDKPSADLLDEQVDLGKIPRTVGHRAESPTKMMFSSGILRQIHERP